MISPYGMEIVECCLTCKLRADRIFCDLPPSALQAFEEIKYTTAYPEGAVLFVEHQEPRGIFLVCRGSVKLSVSAANGKTMIVKIAEAGEVLGLSATVSGRPYEVTASTIDPCQINFVKREDFLRFLKERCTGMFQGGRATQREVSRGLQRSALPRPVTFRRRKLAKLLLEWTSKNGEAQSPSRA
jgi:CRP/FNR family transcriptional regulator, cyclic AMP receptor protein